MTLSQTQLGLKVTLPLHIFACISMKNHTNDSAGNTSSAENAVFITQAVDGGKKNSTTFRKRHIAVIVSTPNCMIHPPDAKPSRYHTSNQPHAQHSRNTTQHTYIVIHKGNNTHRTTAVYSACSKRNYQFIKSVMAGRP